MNAVTGAALAGVIAGAAVAVPLGAIGVLLVQEAVTVGLRTASAGALGVGLVDTAYSAVAVLAGASVNRVLAGHEPGVQLVGAALLVGVAIRGLIGVWRAWVSPMPDPAPIGQFPLRVLARFVALTAINPITAVYFVALAAGSGAAVHGIERGGAFVAGVLVASLTWQLTLVAAGSLAGARLGPRARVVTGLLGYLVVLGYAARLAANAA